MTSDKACEKLVNFLNRKAFDPVLEASPEDYRSMADKNALKHVQRSTQSEKERYAHYESAQKVRQMFEDDLHSEPAMKVHDELERLHLPTLLDVREEFEHLCETVGVK